MKSRPTCTVESCRNLTQQNRVKVDKTFTYQRKCWKHRSASLESYRFRARPYLRYKKGVCEICEFVPVHECQLDVDHIDGNHQNNDPTNLQTLCSNCHRLKTMMNRDLCKIKEKK